jgi:membrane protease YdiL (CAAX protease family)
MNGQAVRRAAALLEVLGVTATGPLLMWGLRQLLGVSIVNPLAGLRADTSDAELLLASGQMLELLMFQYCGYFVLAVPLNWWYRRQGFSAFGLTLAGRHWRSLALAALAAAALSAGPTLMVSFVNSLHPSETAPWRQALMDMSWQRWQFWLFTAVMSWALIPLLEELFYRGYCLRRLAEDWGDGTAVIGSACLFTFMHSQYLILTPYNVAAVATLFAFAIGVGIAFVWSRSLVPGVVAHVSINFPTAELWQLVVLVLLVPAIGIAWRPGIRVAKQVFRQTSPTATLVVAVACIAYPLAMADEAIWKYGVAVALLLIAIVLEALHRQPAGQTAAWPQAERPQ